jgi:predicted kinase
MKTLRGFLIEANKKATVTFMIGPPGVGKTTYIKKEGLKNVLSRDDIVMNHGHKLGLTNYNLIFSKIDQNAVNKELNSKFDKLIQDGKNFVIDMTMMNRKSRSKFLSRIPKYYIKNAVAFETDLNTLKKRNKLRSAEGKNLPLNLLIQMLSSYEPPTEAEGFDDIEIKKI